LSCRPYGYGLIVTGGGSGGLACSKEAATLGKKILVLDYAYVASTTLGITWDFGVACINVGCISKKLIHYAAAFLGQHYFWKICHPSQVFPK
uniref:L-amino-acid oxidase n=1 Tax=Salvator merianae TaxID=96440 RepID=A0A8D0DYS4_SALMN